MVTLVHSFSTVEAKFCYFSLLAKRHKFPGDNTEIILTIFSSRGNEIAILKNATAFSRVFPVTI